MKKEKRKERECVDHCHEDVEIVIVVVVGVSETIHRNLKDQFRDQG